MLKDALPQKYMQQLTLTYKNIEVIGLLPPNSQFLQITQLYLSHNKIGIKLLVSSIYIVKLDGIEQFLKLRSLSLSHNLIEKIEELCKVNKQLKYLNIDNNPFVRRNYNYHTVIYKQFEKLKRLDGEAVNQSQNIKLIKLSEEFAQRVLYLLMQLEEHSQISQNKLQPKQSNTGITQQIINHLIQFTKPYQGSVEGLDMNQESITQIFIKFVELQKRMIPEVPMQQSTEAVVQQHYETFRLLVLHQNTRNYTSFTDHLSMICSEQGHSNHYKAFVHNYQLQVDLFEKLINQIDQEKSQLSSHIVTAYEKQKNSNFQQLDQGIDTFKQRRQIQEYQGNGKMMGQLHEQKTIRKQNMHFPIFAFRHEYLQAILFIIFEKLGNLEQNPNLEDMYQQNDEEGETRIKQQNTQVKQEVAKPKNTKTNKALQKIKNSSKTIKNCSIPLQLNDVQLKQQTNLSKQAKESIKEPSIPSTLIKQIKLKSFIQLFAIVWKRMVKRKHKQFINKIQINDQNILSPFEHRRRGLLSKAFQGFRLFQQQKLKVRQDIQNEKLVRTAFIGLLLNKKEGQSNKIQYKQGLRLIKQKYLRNILFAIQQLKDNYHSTSLRKRPLTNGGNQQSYPTQRSSANTCQGNHVVTIKKQIKKQCSVCNYELL